MSGRKSTEVNGLLARGKDARNAGNENYLKNISAAENILKANEKKIMEINSRIAGQTLVISEVCQLEFLEESEQLKKQFESLCKSNKPVNYEKTINEFQKKSQKLDIDQQKADNEGERIRESIRNKNWYCDNEYQDANKLLKTYKKISSEKNILVAEINQKAQASKKELIQYQNIEKQVLQIISSYKLLEERAQRIAELHQKASEIKDYIRKSIKKIDSQLAEKFLSKEYRELQQKCDDFEKLTDEEVTEGITELSQQIGLFENHLNICYNKFLECKEKAKAAIEGNKHLLKVENNFFYEPTDYAKNKENAKKIKLLEYLSDFSDKEELINKIELGLKQAENYLNEEQFDKVERQTQLNNNFIQQAMEYATILQEHLIENFYVAKDIRSVMRQMGFETGAFKIDGSVKNGWKILAKNPGGDIIDFTQVFINDNGEVKIDIDHHTIGNCPTKWEDITKAFDNAGIHIEKIDMVNGGNILNKREQKKNTDVQDTEQLQVQSF